MCSSVEPSTSPFVQISQVEEEKKEIEHLKLRLLHTFFSLFVYVNFFVSFGFLNRSIFRSICVWFFSRPTVFCCCLLLFSWKHQMRIHSYVSAHMKSIVKDEANTNNNNNKIREKSLLFLFLHLVHSLSLSLSRTHLLLCGCFDGFIMILCNRLLRVFFLCIQCLMLDDGWWYFNLDSDERQ